MYMSIYPLSCKDEAMAKRNREKVDAICKTALTLTRYLEVMPFTDPENVVLLSALPTCLSGSKKGRRLPLLRGSLTVLPRLDTLWRATSSHNLVCKLERLMESSSLNIKMGFTLRIW
jgi:hypothetical protein